MKSIRLSLLIYLLLLVCLAMGGFSYLMYENSRQVQTGTFDATQKLLQAENERTQALLQERYEITKKTLQDSFDESLLLKTQALVGRLATATQSNYRSWSRPLATILSGLGPMPSAAVSGPGLGALFYEFRVASDPWLLFRRFRFRPEPLRLLSSDVKVVEDAWSQSAEGTTTTYFQLFDDKGERLERSRSLGTDQLHLDPKALSTMETYGHRFEDVVLASGVKVRQATLKTPVANLSMTFPSFGERRSGSSPTSRPRPVVVPVDPQFVADGQLPVVYLLFAQSTKMDRVLDDLREDLTASRTALEKDLKQTLADLDDHSQQSLAALRTKLLLVSFLTFLFTVVGVIWLVYRGLSPVQRITEAVSQVSERHFELPLTPEEVPAELVPIVERLKLALASLEKAFNREKQAAADISHELRTPIAALLATAQVCLRKSRSPEEYRTALESCTEIGQQLNVLVERLLTLARLDAGADSIRPVPVDVPELAEHCTTLVRPLAEARGLTLRFERNGPVVLNTDPEKLREVLTNLLHNAIQYNRPNGSIELSIERRNGQVNLEVCDTGIGIPPEARGHLFERFYRVDPSRQSDTTHAGLGLAIVKGYLDLMGGKIEVESVEGQGSTFRVVLPINS